jgi:hypothetical protein
MPTNFPTSVDVLTNPVSNDSLNSPSHSLQHTNANDAIEAVEGYLLTGAGKTGLVHLATQTFTSTTAVNVDGAFTADYASYKVYINFSGSAVSYATVGFQYRKSGSSLSANTYYGNAGGLGENGAVTSLSVSAQTSAFMTAHWTPSATDVELTISDAFATTATATLINHMYQGATQFVFGSGGIYYGTAASVDGFRFTCSNAMTGTVRIYGLRNS